MLNKRRQIQKSRLHDTIYMKLKYRQNYAVVIEKSDRDLRERVLQVATDQEGAKENFLEGWKCSVFHFVWLFIQHKQLSNLREGDIKMFILACL